MTAHHYHFLCPLYSHMETCHKLVEHPPFLTKSFQLHDIYNYVSTRFFKFLDKIMTITN
jgi:hypothetical protein